MTTKDLKDFIKVMRKQGVLRLKSGDLEIELSEEAVRLPQKRMKPSSQSQNKINRDYTDEEILLWSASGGTDA